MTQIPDIITMATFTSTSVLCVVLLFPFCFCAQKWPQWGMTIISIIAFLASFSVLAIRAYTLRRRGQHSWSINRMNTVLMFVLMYIVIGAWSWAAHSDLTTTKLDAKLESVGNRIQFPNIAFVQRSGWLAYGSLSPERKASRCFLNDSHLDLLSCAEANEEQLKNPAFNCDCSSFWQHSVERNFVLGNDTVNILVFRSTESSHGKVLFLNSEEQKLILQVFFVFDVSEATNEESFEPVPMVDVMLIDPDFPVEDAIRQGLVSTVTTPANGLSKVGIRLNRVQKLNEKPQYKYGLHADHFPARSMPCDISGGKEPSDVCTGAVHFQVDSFDRSTNSQVWRLGPWAALSQVGGLYGLVSIFVPILSTLGLRASI